MTTTMTFQDMRTYLIVGKETNDIYETVEAGYGSTTREKAFLHLAKMHLKDNVEYYEEPCRIVRAVCDPTSDDAPWCCGKTFAQAEANYKKGICDNWGEF